MRELAEKMRRLAEATESEVTSSSSSLRSDSILDPYPFLAVEDVQMVD